MLKNIKFPIIIKTTKENSKYNTNTWNLVGICYTLDEKEYCYILKPCINDTLSIYSIQENDLVNDFKILNIDKTLSDIEVIDTSNKSYKNIFEGMSDDEISDFFSCYK